MWLKLTDEAFPRLSIVRRSRPATAASRSYLGPIGSQRQAEVVRDAIHDAVPLRQCTDRLSLRRVVRAACLLAGIGRCSAPCESADVQADYRALVESVRSSWTGDSAPLIEPLRRRMDGCRPTVAYEQAATVRDRISTLVRACARMQRITALTDIAELIAARPDGDGGWELSIVRHGRLAAAGVAPRGVAPMPVIEALRATAEVTACSQGRYRPPWPKRPRSSCAGWSSPASGWSDLAALAAAGPGRRAVQRPDRDRPRTGQPGRRPVRRSAPPADAAADRPADRPTMAP